MCMHFVVRVKRARGACDLPRVMEHWRGISWKSKVAPCHGSPPLPAYYVTLLCASVSHSKARRETDKAYRSPSIHDLSVSRTAHALDKAARPHVPQGDVHVVTSCLTPALLTSPPPPGRVTRASGGGGAPQQGTMPSLPPSTPWDDPGLAAFSCSVPINPQLDIHLCFLSRSW